MYHERTTDAASGKWRGILMTLGVPEASLSGRHAPCPMCGGTDRFRFDNKNGSGSYICGQCGAGYGMQLAERFLGLPFKEAAARVDEILGNVKFEPDRRKALPDEVARQLKREAWKASRPIRAGDAVDRYLSARHLGMDDYPEALRTCERLQESEGRYFPAMLATISDVAGKPVSLHRTFLVDACKAAVESPRKMMPGTLPDGACVRLSGPRAEIGLAEGIETALACERLFDTPTWAAISASLMGKWQAPDGVERVTVFADNDGNFAGQSAGFRLANRLSAAGIEVNVRVPDVVGEDWADVWRRAA